jgi:hypothetical protein
MQQRWAASSLTSSTVSELPLRGESVVVAYPTLLHVHSLVASFLCRKELRRALVRLAIIITEQVTKIVAAQGEDQISSGELWRGKECEPLRPPVVETT